MPRLPPRTKFIVSRHVQHIATDYHRRYVPPAVERYIKTPLSQNILEEDARAITLLPLYILTIPYVIRRRSHNTLQKIVTNIR